MWELMVLKKIVEIAGLKFGEGLPKICVPLTSDGEPEIGRAHV